MDIQAAAGQLMGFLGDNPDLLGQFVKHPYSTTAQATGTDENISKGDMSQILTQVAAQSTGQDLPVGDIAGIASSLLGDNGGSIHQLAGSLFGGGGGDLGSMAEIAAKSIFGGVAAQGAASLITGALGLGKK